MALPSPDLEPMAIAGEPALLGTDPLWAEDSLARVAYSSNPGFSENGSVVPLPASEHILASPEIIDALEVVHKLAHPQGGSRGHELVIPELPPEIGLVRKGLKRLRSELSDRDLNPRLQLAVADTKKHLNGSGSLESNLLINSLTPDVSQTETNVRPEREDLQLQYQQELIDTVAAYKESSLAEHDYTTLLSLASELILTPDPEGFSPDYKPRFSRRLAQVVNGYMERPSDFLEELKAQTALAEFIGEKSEIDDAERNASFNFVRVTLSAIAQETRNRTYTARDLTSDTIKKWLSLGKDLPGDSEVFKRLVVPDGINIYTEQEDEDVRGLAMVSCSMIMSNSLVNIAHRQPRDLVEAMFLIAEAGMSMDEAVPGFAALTSLRIALENSPRVSRVLSLSVGANGHPQIQQKAIDLQISLVDQGVPQRLVHSGHSALFDGVTVSEADREISKIARELYPTILAQRYTPRMRTPEFLKEVDGWFLNWRDNFLKFAASSEGQETTIFGRLHTSQQINALMGTL